VDAATDPLFGRLHRQKDNAVRGKYKKRGNDHNSFCGKVIIVKFVMIKKKNCQWM
jgi:hypothetical protein